MGFYSRVVFPGIIDFVMTTGQMKKRRSQLLADVSGDIFEIGFGTGLNLPFYPEGVQEITTVDINPGMNRRAQKRIAESGITVHMNILSAESLPMDDETFDSVVCTWTLCSIENVEKALSEVRRVLRPGGKFFFVEHGASPDPKVRRLQDRLNSFWGIIGDGCNLNRNAEELIQDQHFEITSLDKGYMEKSPRFAGYMYQGVATKT
ncbi:MAG: class I SAM-dependent methyltransferase [Candidatus Hydrogenedentes bacterium]|nr:class I SAM-dependent methyltransferase [Candidatus Hydrogenedentota bacterium]